MILLLLASAFGFGLFLLSLIMRLPNIMLNIMKLCLGLIIAAVELLVLLLRGLSFILMHTIFLPYHLKVAKQDLRVYRKNKMFRSQRQWSDEQEFQSQIDVLYMRTKFAYPNLNQNIYDEYRNEILDAFDTTRDEKELNRLHEAALIKIKKAYYNL